MTNNSSYSQVFENYGLSDISSGEQIDIINAEPVMFKYNWKIKGVISNNRTLNIFQELVSPLFPSNADSELQWNLMAKESKNANGIAVKLVLASSNVQEVSANYKFKLLDSGGNVIANWKVGPSKTFKQDELPNLSDFMELYSNIYYGSGCPNLITIVCEIIVPASQLHPIKNQKILRSSTNPIFQFSEQLQTMFDNEEFSDVTFSVQGRELQAHKVILAAGSSVFKAMFGHDMMEKKHNRVEISDIEFEVLRELIRFIYTDNVFNLEKMANNLFVASDKYELEKLKNICESVLCKNVATENAAEMFIFADMYRADLLKEKAKQYIIGHSNAVSNTSGWKSMIVTHPHLLAEAFLALSHTVNPKSVKGRIRTQLN